MNADQYHTILGTAGVTHLPDWNVLTISGRHRTRWLQGMITQDIKSLQPGEVRYSCLTTAKGKVLTDFQVFNALDGDQFYLIMREENIDLAITHLKKFIIAEDVQLTNQSDQLELLTIQGTNASAILGVQSPVASVDISGIEITAVRYPRTMAPGYDLIVPREALSDVLSHLKTNGAQELTVDALNAMRIEAAIPAHGIDFDDSNIPQEACLNDALHWSKGCYVGQEVIARLQYRGHTNKELRQIQISGNKLPEPGAPIFPDAEATKAIGKITCAAIIPSTGCILALGYVRRAHFEPNTELLVEMGDARVDAKVSDAVIRATLTPGE